MEHQNAPPFKRPAPAHDQAAEVIISSTASAAPTPEQEPKVNWVIDAFHYWADESGDWTHKPASIYLSSDEAGQPRGVQFWSIGAPTVYHGNWSRGAGTLQATFNCRGPTPHEDGSPRRLKTTYVRCQKDGSWQGEDTGSRKVKMVPYGSWQVQQKSEGVLCYIHHPPLEDRIRMGVI